MADEVSLKPVSFDPFAAGARPAGFPVETPEQGQAAAARSLEILKKEQAERPDDPSLKREITRTERLAGGPAPVSQVNVNRGARIADERKRGPAPVFQLEGEKKPSVELRPVDFDPFAGPDTGVKAGDFAKSGAAGVLSGTGMIAQGGGELLARGINMVGGKLGFDPQARAVNPMQGWINDLLNARSPAAKKAEANSQISGELLKPETWNFGNDPNVAGIALQGMNAIGQFAPNLGVALVTAGASIPAQLAIGATVGGLQALGGGAEQERTTINGMSHDDLMAKSKLYAELVGRGVPQGQAKEAVAEAAALGGGIGNAIPSAAEGAFENFLIGALTKGKIKIPSLGGGAAGRVATGVLGGGAMGGAEEAVEQAGQNIGSNVAIGGNRPVGDDTLQQFVMGMIAEGAAGGGAGVLSKSAQPAPAAVTAAQEPVSAASAAPQEGPAQTPSAGAPGAGPASGVTAAPRAEILSPIDQARVDAQTLKGGGDLPGADDARLKNATLLAVYGENAAVRHVIDAPGQFSAIGDAMLMAAPTVERVRATLKQGAAQRDITPDILGAIDELAKIKAAGQSVAQVMAHGVGHDVSFEGQQLIQFLDENANNPKRIAGFLESYLQEVENATGVPSKVRGRAFDIIAEQHAARKKADEEKALAQVAEVEKADADKLKKVRDKVAMIRAETALADLKAKAAKPAGQTAIEAAFEKAKTLKGRIVREKPSAESDGAVQERKAAHPATGPAKGEGSAARSAGAVPQPAQADHGGNARPVRSGSDRQGAGEVAVNRGAQIAGELTQGEGTRENPVIASRPKHINRAAARAAEQPTSAQKGAGNYAKGHFRFAEGHPLAGLGVISIETAKGKERVAKDGSWSVPNLPSHYGHLQIAEGADGDKADISIGDDLNAKHVYVIDQIDPETKRFDETKSMAGFSSQKAAEAVYVKSFTDGQGKARIGAITEMTAAQYVARAQSDGLKAAVAYQDPNAPLAVPADAHEMLRLMAENSGWTEQGSHAIRENGREGEVVGRTAWVGKPDWAKASQGANMTVAEIKTAVEKAIAGKPLTQRQRRMVEGMIDELKESRADVQAAGGENLPADEQAIVSAAVAAVEPDPAPWLTMSEAEKNDHLDSLFGPAKPVAQGEGSGAQGAAAEVRPEGAREPGEDDERPALALTGQSPAEVAAQAAQAAAQAAQSAAESVKAAVDEMRGAFTLTGSNRAADEAAARGQQDLLANDEKPAFSRAQVPIFYSELVRRVEALKTNAAPSAQWKATIKAMPGVKADEIEWSGVNDWLEMQPGKVTKGRVLGYLAQNGVKVEETMLGNKGATSEIDRLMVELDAKGYSVTTEPGVLNADDVVGLTRRSDRQEFDITHDARRMAEWPDMLGIDELPDDVLTLAQDLARASNEYQDEEDPASTKFERYTLPGGKNYRELLLTLPQKIRSEDPRLAAARAINQKLIEKYNGLSEAFDKWTPGEKSEFDRVHGEAAKAPATLPEPGFQSSHFDQPNILAHVRFNERADAEGKKVLFIEEIQSDWAQKGKRAGFVVDRSGIDKRLEEIWQETERMSKDRLPDNRMREEKRWHELVSERDALQKKRDGTPSAPFVGKTEAWVSLALKRMIRYAAENGFDRVAWTNGEQQADRYDLSKHVDRVEVVPLSKMNFSFDVLAYRNNEQVVSKTVDRNGISDVVGKEVAAKALQQIDSGKSKALLKGLDLKIGGEGMLAFYDKLLPNIANDVLKKVGGGRVGEVYLSPTGEAKLLANDSAAHAGAIGAAPQPGFDITPKMREQAMQGLPMFSRVTMGEGLMPDAVRKVIEPILERWGNAPEVRVLGSMAEAPEAVRAHDEGQRSQGASGSPSAFFWGGKVYLVANEFKSPRAAQIAILHEVLGHAGLRGVFGDRLNQILDRVAFDFKVRVAAKAAEYGLDVKNVEQRRQASEEVLAELAKTGRGATLVQRAVAAIREFLRAVGLDIKLSANDIISNYILPARGFIERGRAQRALETAPAFSRTAPALPASTFASARTLFDNVTHSDRVLNRVISKFNTPFHIAETHPEFKPVYDEAQDYNQDVSRVANETADLAPDLLPRIESFADFKKSAPSNEDIASTANALYAGTLWGGGSPLEGRVWTDEELRTGRARDGNITLRAFDPVNEQQIKLYRQALASVGHSLTEHAKSLVWRLAKQKGIRLQQGSSSLASMVAVADDLAKTQAEGKSDALRGADDEVAVRLKEEIAELDAFRKALNDIQAKTEGLIEHGYFPAMRFGQYAVNVQTLGADGKWKEEFFGRYETQTAANLAKEELQRDYPAATSRVTSGVMNDDAHKFFQGLNLDALELFSEHMRDDSGQPISADPIMQEYFRVAVTERSTLKRQIHRKGTPGFSRDVPRALAQFTVSNATSASRNYHAADMLAKVQKIKAGDLQAYATRYVRYLQDPQEESPALRGFLANYYILGSIAFGAVNMTQPILMTAPYLSQHTSWAKAMAQLGRAAKDLVTGRKDLTPEEQAAYARAAKAGIVSPQEIHQIRAESRASAMGDLPLWQKLEAMLATKGVALPGKLLMRKAAFLWGSIYSMTEQFNRGTTFLAAYRIGKANNADAYEFAKNAVDATQGVYARSNRPEVSRGAVGATIMTFKQFNIAYLELAKRLYDHDKKAFAVLMLTLMALAGAEGLPFAEDVEDLIDTIGQWMGHQTNAKKSLRKLAVDLLGQDIADVMLHGASAIPGVPIDVANRMGMHNVIPGTAMLKTSEPDKTRDLLEILGPAATLFQNAGTAATGLATGRPGDVKGMLPSALQNALKAAEMVDTGSYRDTKGRKVMDVDAVDAFSKMIGFQPAKVARETRLVGQNQQDIALHRVIEDSIASKWAHGTVDKDPSAVAEAVRQWKDWNATNPSMPVAITGAQIARRIKELQMSREERFVRSAPKEIRGDVARDLRQ